MSDTPRTDEAEFVIQGDHVVYADFARQLEQELALFAEMLEEADGWLIYERGNGSRPDGDYEDFRNRLDMTLKHFIPEQES